jgi:pimeloyl-ACP methyl ester carboxylesterase
MDGIELATEAFGDSAHPPALLIMGAMASMLWWPDEFCERLANRARYVIRFDNRDTGHSTIYEPGRSSYTLKDMADDAIRVLDGYGLSSAHVIGMSMGGVIGQLAALKHPARVASLTVISSSPLSKTKLDLPSPSPTYIEHSTQFAAVDWTNRAQSIRFLVEDSRQIAGSAHPFNEARLRSLIEQDYDRARNFASVTNHTTLKGGEVWEGLLHGIRAPLLAIHGTADPIFPIEHGVALSNTVAGATLVSLKGTGHELHPADWDDIIASIVEHTGH